MIIRGNTCTNIFNNIKCDKNMYILYIWLIVVLHDFQLFKTWNMEIWLFITDDSPIYFTVDKSESNFDMIYFVILTFPSQVR